MKKIWHPVYGAAVVGAPSDSIAPAIDSDILIPTRVYLLAWMNRGVGKRTYVRADTVDSATPREGHIHAVDLWVMDVPLAVTVPDTPDTVRIVSSGYMHEGLKA